MMPACVVSSIIHPITGKQSQDILEWLCFARVPTEQPPPQWEEVRVQTLGDVTPHASTPVHSTHHTHTHLGDRPCTFLAGLHPAERGV